MAFSLRENLSNKDNDCTFNHKYLFSSRYRNKIEMFAKL